MYLFTMASMTDFANLMLFGSFTSITEVIY